MTPQELRARIERFADEVITLCGEAPADALRLQLLLQLQRAATSTAANYRAACRAQSRPTFIAKLSIALEEADEAEGWLRRLAHQRQDQGEVVNRLLKEANEITAILNASRRTASGSGKGRRPRY